MEKLPGVTPKEENNHDLDPYTSILKWSVWRNLIASLITFPLIASILEELWQIQSVLPSSDEEVHFLSNKGVKLVSAWYMEGKS